MVAGKEKARDVMQTSGPAAGDGAADVAATIDYQYNAGQTQKTRWLRVSRHNHCPICGKPDWCSVAEDGSIAICMRESSDKPTKNGGWLHPLANVPPRTSRAPRREPTRSLPPVEHRDTVYRALIAELGLSTKHLQHLLYVRRLPEMALGCFASLAPLSPRERYRLAESVSQRSGCSVAGVPGFWRGRAGWCFVSTDSGFLVPVLDRQGRVQGLQVRRDNPQPDQPRYCWLSSNKWNGGASSGSPVAIWRPDLAEQGIRLTEGSLKAAIAAYHLPACVVAVAGVSNWRAALSVLEGLGATAVTIAYDMDAERNPHVERAREALALALARKGLAVRVALWDPAYKGIDDVLLAGAAVDVADWHRGVLMTRRPTRTCRLSTPARPTGVKLSPPTRPKGVPLSAKAKEARA